MTKRPFVLIIVAALIALHGCTMSGSKIVTDTNKVPDNLTFPPPPEEARFYFERSIHSSNDVKVDTEAEKFRRAMTGERAKGEGLAKPYGIAVNRGRMFVGDTVLKNVAVFDFPQQKFFRIGDDEDDEGHGKLALPMGLDTDKQGNLYVFDGKLKQIIVYNRDGKYLRAIGDPSTIARPAGIAVNPEGTRVYAADIGGSSSNEHRVVVFDAQTGEQVQVIGKRGTEKGEFNLPRDTAIAPDGSLYVVDSGNFRVEKFTADGKFISTFGSIGRQRGQFSRPKEAALDKNGNIYVTDAAFGNFQIFNPEGQLLLDVGSRSNGDGPAKFSLPAGIAVDEDGRVYMVDQYFRKVDIFRPASLATEDGYIGSNAILNKDKLGKPAPAESNKLAPVTAEPAEPEPSGSGTGK